MMRGPSYVKAVKPDGVFPRGVADFLYVPEEGNVVVEYEGGEVVTHHKLRGGLWHAMRIRRLLASEKPNVLVGYR